MTINLARPAAEFTYETSLLVLNSAIITADGDYIIGTIDSATAIEIAQAAPAIESAIGHESTASLLTELLGVEIPFRRVQVVQQVNQVALIFRLLGRPTSFDMTREELERVGYEFKLMTRTA